MKTAKEIAKNHCLEFIRNEFPDEEFEDHYDAPEWMVEAMKEYAKQALELAAEPVGEKTISLFAEYFSDNGRLITPKLVESEIKQSILSIIDEIEE